MFRIQSRNGSASGRQPIPQGKGREGMRKGRGAETVVALACGVSGQVRIRSNGYLPPALFGFGDEIR